jgi:hypothetical protein
MRKLRNIFFVILTLVLLVRFWGLLYSKGSSVMFQARYSDTLRIYNDLKYLTKDCRFRNYAHPEVLNKAADYIKSEFLQVSDSVNELRYSYQDAEFRNIICSLGPSGAERIIIGAHYDVCGDMEGADDNGSGIAGLLELARLLKGKSLKYRIDLVAYANEEPPFFKTEYMGSYIHAKYLNDHKIKVKGMICLEMIGYFNELKKSQSYPVSFLKWFYGSKGNYILIVQKFGNGSFGSDIKKLMLKNPCIITKSFKSPKWFSGVDFSDHLNYWKFGYSAVMITNTAFYRNYNYHTQNDKLESLCLGRIGLVIDELYRSVLQYNE